jgi:hypothetical protein
MAKLSISAAAKVFDVSRPTLLKHLKNGKISGEKDTAKGWQIDTAELGRVYQAKGGKDGNALPDTLSPFSSDLHGDLKEENERLRLDLAVAEALADERGHRLDQLVPLLMAPKKRRWWMF